PRARLLAAHTGLEALRDPGRAGRRWAAVDRRDAVEPLTAERLARPGEHLGQRLAAADAEQLDRAGLARARRAPDPLRELADGQLGRVVRGREHLALARE